MNQEEIQQAAHEEKWVLKADKVKISPTNMRIDPIMTPKEETYQVILNVIKNSSFFKAFLASTVVPKIYMQHIWHTVTKALDICPRVPGKEFIEPPSEEELLTFLRTLASFINKCLSGKTISNDRLRQSKVAIIWGMFHNKYVEYAKLIWEDFSYQIDNRQLKKSRREIMPYPRFTKIIINHFLSIHSAVPKELLSDTMLTNDIKQSETYQMFIKYSTSLIPPKKTRGKGSQGKKAVVSPKPTNDNIIHDPDVALELGKSISLTEAAKEEAARQVHTTYERIVTKFDPNPARRRPSGIAFRDTSSVSKKMSLDLLQKLKGVQTLTPEEQLTADTMQALKARVLDESTITPKTSDEGTGAKPGVLDEEKVTSKAKADVYSDEDKEKKDDDDDDKKNVDEEMKDAEGYDTRNGDEEITDTEKADAEKTGKNLGDALQKSVQANVINEVENLLPKFLPKAVSDFATLQQAFYDALFNSLSLDDAIVRGQADLEKTLRKRDRDDEDPLAKPNQDDIEQTFDDVVNDVDQPPDDMTQTKDKAPKYDWFKQPHRPPTLDLKWNKHQVVDDQPKQSCFNNMVFVVKDPLTFDELMATPIDLSKYAMNCLKIDKLTKAHLVGLVYNILKGTCQSSIELEYNMEECYKALSGQLD
ncbi:hypothetical protein Tco_1117628 [Tanacetum coccineum]